MGWKEWKEGSQKEAGTQRRADQEREGGRRQKVSEGQEDEQK